MAKKKKAAKAARTAKARKASAARKTSTRGAAARKKGGSRQGAGAAKRGRTSSKTSKSSKTRKSPKAAKRSPARSAAPRRQSSPPQRATAAPSRAGATSAGASAVPPARRPNLDRERRTIREEDMVPSPPSSLNMDRSASAARTGRAEFEQKLRNHTSTGPAMTGGDVDADWEDAEAVGDEAPGGDNPTPDQDIVDEIGRAMGVEYDDDEELQGGEELAERDRHRWELDPASREEDEES